MEELTALPLLEYGTEKYVGLTFDAFAMLLASLYTRFKIHDDTS